MTSECQTGLFSLMIDQRSLVLPCRFLFFHIFLLRSLKQFFNVLVVLLFFVFGEIWHYLKLVRIPPDDAQVKRCTRSDMRRRRLIHIELEAMPKSIFRTRVGTELMMGKIVQTSNIGLERIPCAKVRCTLNEFNIYLKKYFARSFDYWALDRQSQASLGDMVMIKRIEGSQRPTANVSHSVDRIVFQFGNVVDPVTGKRVIKDVFADEQKLRRQLVEEVVDKPLEQDSLLFEERRAVQQQKLEEQKNRATV